MLDTLFCLPLPPIAGTYSIQGQMTYQWVVGQALWNTLVFGLSLNNNSNDANCLYGMFERNPRTSGTAGTDTLHTTRVLYLTNTTPVYFLLDFVGGTGNFGTASNTCTFLTYTRIA